MQNFRLRSPALGSTLLGLFTAGTVLTLTSAASASGFNTARMGGEHGTPTTDTPTAMYYNPAGLADRDPLQEKTPFEFHLFLDGNFAWHTQTFQHSMAKSDVAEPAGATGANNGKAKLLNFATAPMIGANFKIGNFAVAAGFYVPFGGQATWSKNKSFANNSKFAGPYDGVQRWNVIDGDIKSTYITLAAAYDIMKRVSIGASFNLVNSDVNQNRAREPGGTDDISLEGRSYLSVSKWNGSFGVGILGEVVPRKLWLGFSYQSQPGVKGDIVLKGTLQNNFSGAKSNDPAKLYQSLPAIYRFGVRARPVDKFELRFSADITDWSVFKNQCITSAAADACTTDKTGAATKGEKVAPLQNIARDWSATFGARLGASYWVTAPVELFASVGYESNAVPSSTLEPALVDFHNVSPTLGGRFQVQKHLGLEVSYTQFIFIPRDTTGQSTTGTLLPPSKTPDAGGKYTQAIGDTNVSLDLWF